MEAERERLKDRLLHSCGVHEMSQGDNNARACSSCLLLLVSAEC